MLEHFLNFILPTIGHFHSIAYWFALLMALAETTIGVGLFVPGSSIILLMGAMAANGYFDLGDLIWFATMGAIIGDNINYYIGKKYGLEIFEKKLSFVKSRHIQKTRDFFDHHGSKSIFLGRFIPSVKEIVPLIAGIFDMKYKIFMPWNILGAISWSLLWILPAYFFAQSFDLVKIWIGRAGFFLVILIVLFVGLYYLKRVLIKKGYYFFRFLFSIIQSIKKSIIQNEQVQNFVKRHQIFFEFLKKRLNKKHFEGLPLTVFTASLLYVLLLLAGIIEDVVRSNIITSIDERVASLLVIFRSPILVKIFIWITLLGKSQIILIFSLAVLIVLYLQRKNLFIIPFVLSVIGSGIFTYLSKLLFHRARPDLAFYHEQTFSFPSGHATIAVAFYGFIVYLLIKSVKKWKYKIDIFFASIIIIVLIGFSRLFLGVHYLSDVWGGYLVGAIWLIIAITLSEYFLFKKENGENKKTIKKNIISIFIIILALVFYVVYASFYEVPKNILKSANTEKVNNVTEIFKDNNLKYTETFVGLKQEPLSFIIVVKNEQDLKNIFKKADWHLANQVGFKSLFKAAKTILLKEPYLDGPITPGFWNRQVHNFGFEKETKKDSFRTRHHVRIWKTNYNIDDNYNIYVASASFDTGMKWGIIHRIDSDIDEEREFLFKDLKKTGLIKNYKKENLVSPRLGKNFIGDLFFTDGDVYELFFR